VTVRRALSFAPALLLLLTRTTPGAAQALDGTVVLATDSVPVADVPVELHRVTTDSGSVVDSTLSSASGRFRFALDTTGNPEAVYLTAARYHGLRYFGPAVHAGMDSTGAYRIVVFDTALVTAPREDLAEELRHVVITPVPEGALVVGEVIDVMGPTGGRTLLPADSGIAVWQGSLADGAVEASTMEGGLPPESLELQGGRVAIVGALPPDGARLALQYAVEGASWRVTLDHAVRRMDVIVVDGGDVEASGGLRAVSTADIGGRPVRRFTADALPAGTTVSISIPGPPGAGGQALPWFVAGALLLLAAAASAEWNRRRSVP
jgi:hypothetical protein